MMRKARLRVVFNNPYASKKPMCNEAGYRPLTHGDLAIEHPTFPTLLITRNGQTLPVVRDYLSRLDLIVNTDLVFKCLTNGTLSPEEIKTLKSYCLPEVDAKLIEPHFCSKTLLTSTSIPAAFVDAFLLPRPPSLTDNFTQTYWIFRRLVLGDCRIVPAHYRQNYTIYLIEAMHRTHIRVMKKAHAKGMRFNFDQDISKHPEVFFRVIHWLIHCGLLPFYTDKVPASTNGNASTNQTPQAPCDGKPYVPAIVRLIFQYDRSEILNVLLKELGSTNQETIDYATQFNATKCLALLSQFPIA
jgi:hypothetical protein